MTKYAVCGMQELCEVDRTVRLDCRVFAVRQGCIQYVLITGRNVRAVMTICQSWGGAPPLEVSTQSSLHVTIGRLVGSHLPVGRRLVRPSIIMTNKSDCRTDHSGLLILELETAGLHVCLSSSSAVVEQAWPTCASPHPDLRDYH